MPTRPSTPGQAWSMFLLLFSSQTGMGSALCHHGPLASPALNIWFFSLCVITLLLALQSSASPELPARLNSSILYPPSAFPSQHFMTVSLYDSLLSLFWWAFMSPSSYEPPGGSKPPEARIGLYQLPTVSPVPGRAPGSWWYPGNIC